MRKETILTGVSLQHPPSNFLKSAVVIYPRSFSTTGFLYNLKYKQTKTPPNIKSGRGRHYYYLKKYIANN